MASELRFINQACRAGARSADPPPPFNGSREMPRIQILKQVLPAVTIIEPTLPSDPALRAVIDDVAARLRYSFAAAAADEQVAAPGRADQAFRAFFTSRSPASRARFRERGAALLSGPPVIRAAHLGRYAAVDLKEYRTLGSEGMTGRFGKPAVDSAALVTSLERLRDRVAALPKLPQVPAIEHETADVNQKQVVIKLDPDVIGGLMFKKMRLFINKVRCIEETDEIGSDEINLGGTVTTPFGNSSIVNEFEVSSDFDEGEAVNFGMSKVFTSWNLETKSAGFPYVYATIIAMSEKDDGGFYKFLKALWEQIDQEVKKAIAGLVGAAIGGALGTAFGPLGTVVGVLVGALFGILIDWMLTWFNNPDDIVGAKAVLMTLASSRKSYYDWAKLTSAAGWKTTLHFKGDGGRYDVDCSFKVFTQ
jgi:hypothetical protein